MKKLILFITLIMVLSNFAYCDDNNSFEILPERGEEGDEQDHKEAVKWWTKAAEQGDTLAQCNLALMYYFGEGAGKENDVDGDMLGLLGAKTKKKHWLGASLGKTIRLHQGL